MPIVEFVGRTHDGLRYVHAGVGQTSDEVLREIFHWCRVNGSSFEKLTPKGSERLFNLMLTEAALAGPNVGYGSGK